MSLHPLAKNYYDNRYGDDDNYHIFSSFKQVFMMTVSVHFVEKHDGWDDDYDVLDDGFFEQGWRWTQIGLVGHVFKTWKLFFFHHCKK